MNIKLAISSNFKTLNSFSSTNVVFQNHICLFLKYRAFSGPFHSSSSVAKMPFLVIFSQRRRPNNPVVKIRIKPVIPSMSAKWYLVNSCRPTIARNIPIPAPVALLELDIPNLGCPFMALAFCRHHRGSTERPVNAKGHHNGPEGRTQDYGYVTK